MLGALGEGALTDGAFGQPPALQAIMTRFPQLWRLEVCQKNFCLYPPGRADIAALILSYNCFLYFHMFFPV